MFKMTLVFSLLKHVLPLWKGAQIALFAKFQAHSIFVNAEFCHCLGFEFLHICQNCDFLFVFSTQISFEIEFETVSEPWMQQICPSIDAFLPPLWGLLTHLYYNLLEQFLVVLPSDKRQIFGACDSTFYQGSQSWLANTSTTMTA